MDYFEEEEILKKIQEEKNRDRLAKARAGATKRNLLDNSMALAKSATPWGAASLLKYMFITSPVYHLLALMVAFLKDVLDWIGIGSLPVIGTAITICVSIFIFFMLLMAGSENKVKMASKVARRYLLLAGGTIIEFLFGINFLPVLTLTVLVVWFMAAAEKKAEMEAKKRSPSLSEKYA